MSADEAGQGELGGTGYELFIGALSVLSLVNIVLVSLLRDEATQNVIYVMDAVLSVVFLIDFLVRLRRAPARGEYFLRQYGWADLLASLPFPQVKILRIFRLIRVSRLLRRYGVGNIGRSLLRDRAGSALLTLLLVGLLVLQFGSLAMLALERDAPDANITTASDALWYLVVTMSTVGYGDQFPVSNPGRQLGAVVIVVGVGIFGTLTGYLANLFLAPRNEPAAEAEATQDDARRQLEDLKQLLRQQQDALDRLELVIRGGRD
ncbi:MAG: ion transporter [Actinomycetia bacterium]|nr:ion transporter [Actinomycetes bacterium]